MAKDVFNTDAVLLATHVSSWDRNGFGGLRNRNIVTVRRLSSSFIIISLVG